MSGTLYAFNDAFDAAIILAENLCRGMNQDILMFMFIDLKKVLNIITQRKRFPERRLVSDVAFARDPYRRFEIEHVGLVH